MVVGMSCSEGCGAVCGLVLKKLLLVVVRQDVRTRHDEISRAEIFHLGGKFYSYNFRLEWAKMLAFRVNDVAIM